MIADLYRAKDLIQKGSSMKTLLFGNRTFRFLTDSDLAVDQLNIATAKALFKKCSKIALNRMGATFPLLRLLLEEPEAYPNIKTLALELHSD